MAMSFNFFLVENLPPKLLAVSQGFEGTHKLDASFKNQKPSAIFCRVATIRH